MFFDPFQLRFVWNKFNTQVACWQTHSCTCVVISPLIWFEDERIFYNCHLSTSASVYIPWCEGEIFRRCISGYAEPLSKLTVRGFRHVHRAFTQDYQAFVWNKQFNNFSFSLTHRHNSDIHWTQSLFLFVEKLTLIKQTSVLYPKKHQFFSTSEHKLARLKANPTPA